MVRIASAVDQVLALRADVAAAARLTRDLPPFLRHPLTAAEAHLRVQARLATREARFFEVLERAIYVHPDSPYLRLLRAAGCELGDVRALVATEGIEGALRVLADRGVYVSFDEMKGRRETVRGSARFRFHDADFASPISHPHFIRFTGGTGGRPSRVGTSLAFIEEWGTSVIVTLAAHGVHEPAGAHWWPISIPHNLLFARMGLPTLGWFYPVHPLPRPALLAARYVRMLGQLAGADLPLPQRCDLDDPLPLARWLAARATPQRPIAVWATASAGARLGQAAAAAGVSLRGVALVIGSEAVTDSRRQHVEAAGAQVIAKYGTIELSGLSHACATPSGPDDVHLHRDRYALIQRPLSVGDGGPTVDALYFTNLSPNSGVITLNVAPGDYAHVEERDCGCALGALGMRTHLSEIGSYEKLTGEGVTFARSNLQHVLDSLLPARFGGTGLDYQLAEEEASDSTTRLILRVSPAVGPIDEQALRAAFLQLVGQSGPVDAYQARIWHDAGTLQIRREGPVATAAGKVLPFQFLPRRSTRA